MPTTIILNLLTAVVVTVKHRNLKNENRRLTCVSKQVMFDLIDCYFSFKKQRGSFNTHAFACAKEKPQVERQLAHAQTFDRGVDIVFLIFADFGRWVWERCQHYKLYGLESIYSYCSKV